jgi:hypothetical protein
VIPTPDHPTRSPALYHWATPAPNYYCGYYNYVVIVYTLAGSQIYLVNGYKNIKKTNLCSALSVDVVMLPRNRREDDQRLGSWDSEGNVREL